jgi:hypothetical protein
LIIRKRRNSRSTRRSAPPKKPSTAGRTADQIDQRKEAAHIFQPAPDRIAKTAAAIIDGGPHAQNIFGHKDCGRDTLDRHKGHGIALAHPRHGFEDDGDDIDDDESRKRDIEDANRQGARRIVVEKPTQAGA